MSKLHNKLRKWMTENDKNIKGCKLSRVTKTESRGES